MEKLYNLRIEIDKIDRELINLLAQRMDIARNIGDIKRKNNITILQQNRYDAMLIERVEIAKQLHLNKEFIVELFNIIHKESVTCQND